MKAVQTVSRRTILGGTGLLLAAATQSCTALQVVLGCYPSRYDDDALSDRVLRGFMTAVIPGVPREDENLVRVFSDPQFPFAAHRGYFVYDLCRRTADRFDSLSLKDRLRAIQDGIEDGSIHRRLYRGAIFLGQAATYGGIYDPGGCALIDFPGPNEGFPRSIRFYPDAKRYLARASSANGNLA